MNEQNRDFEAWWANRVEASKHPLYGEGNARAAYLTACRTQDAKVRELPWKVLHGGEVQAAFRNETDARHSIRNEPSRTKLTITGPSDIDRDANTTIATLTAENERKRLDLIRHLEEKQFLRDTIATLTAELESMKTTNRILQGIIVELNEQHAEQ